jgi:hypothetical protein
MQVMPGREILSEPRLLMGKSFLNGGFSSAKLDYQRVMIVTRMMRQYNL